MAFKFFFGNPPVEFYLRPDADDTDGTWTDQAGGTTLYAAIDEAVVDDADYIKSVSNPSADACKIRLANPAVTPAEPFRVIYRYRKSGDQTIDLIVRLYQGAATIASWTNSNISSSFATTEQTLSGAEFASITDFDDLYIGFEADVGVLPPPEIASTGSVTYGVGRTTTTIPAPSGITDGELLVAFINLGDATAEPPLACTPPAGWADLDESPIAISKSAPATIGFYCFYKIAASESGDYDFTHAGAESEGLILRVTGADVLEPFNPTPVVDESITGVIVGVDGTTITASGITTVADNSLVLMVSCSWDGGPTSAPSEVDPTFDEIHEGVILYACGGVMAVAGATGEKTQTNGNSTANPWCVYTIAIQP